jgi:hypothetical protein
MKSQILLLTALAFAASLSFAQAQSFTNGAAATNGSIEDVGSILYAFNFDNTGTAADVTINGVPFVGTSITNGSTTDFSIDGGGMDGTGGGDSSDSSQVKLLNENGVYGGSTYVLKGLTIGTTYAAQFIFDADPIDNRYVALTDGTQTSNTVTGGVPGPQYITDTFTATGAMETLTRANDGGLQLSGFVVETVPEPGTWALMGLGLAGFVLLARRKLARA